MRYALVTVAAAACLAFGGVAQASPHVTPQLQKSHMQDRTFTGRVESVNLTNDTFVVRKVVDGRLHEKEFKMDPETQVKIDVVKGRLIRDYGYDDESATDVLNYVASIFARGDAKS